MKLKKLHLFLILLAVLILSSLGIGVLENFGVIEGNENLMNSKISLNSAKNRKAGNKENPALKDGSKYNPFNNVKFRNLSKDKKPMKFSDSNGITKDEIPPGDEHLYILKSEVVPPVCPKCPDCPRPKCNNGKGSCPPCPRPERCPEPAFTCKKVPNYSVSSVDSALPSPMFMSGAGGAGGSGDSGPIPVLNSFAKFS